MMKQLLMSAAIAALAIPASATVVTVWEGNQPFDGWGATVEIKAAAFENAQVGDKVITNLTVDLTLNGAEYAQIIYKKASDWNNLPGENVEQFPQPGDTQSVYTITEETLPLILENGLRIQGLNFIATSMQIDLQSDFNPNIVYEGSFGMNWWPGLECARDVFAAAKAGDHLLVDYELNHQVSPVEAPEGLLPTPYYSYNFEDNDNPLGGAEIIGGGQIVNVGGPYGKVFANAKGGMRENYLKLPADVFAKTGETKQFSISFFVNSKLAGESGDYYWSPIFSAYDHNSMYEKGESMPMFVCQYRGQVQINCNGSDNVGDAWCDFGDNICDQGKVTWRHGDTDWLADKKWHHYAATFTNNKVVVYIDGEVLNSWTLDGVSAGQRCEIFGDERFDVFCLGGMQAWEWTDPDPGFMFDDVNLYDVELSEEQINAIIAAKGGDCKGEEADPLMRLAFQWQNTPMPAMVAWPEYDAAENFIVVPTTEETGTYDFVLSQEDVDLLKKQTSELGWDAYLRILGQSLNVTKVEYSPENAVEAIETPAVADDAWYNLQGIRVANPQHGIFIHNGKKIVIK